MRKELVLLAFVSVSPSGAHAATMYAQGYVFGPVPTAAGGFERAELADDQYSDDTALTGPSRSALARIDQGGTVYQGEATADIRSGEFSTAILAEMAHLPDNLSRAETFAAESMEIRGNGSVEFRLDLDAAWDVAGLDASNPDFSALVLFGGLYIARPGSLDEARPFFRVRESGDAPQLSGRITDTVSHVRSVGDGDILNFHANVYSYLENSGVGGTASLAAVLSIVPSPGVTVTYGDPAFLSGGTNPPEPIPLPASGVLLLGVIAGSGLLRRFRSRTA